MLFFASFFSIPLIMWRFGLFMVSHNFCRLSWFFAIILSFYSSDWLTLNILSAHWFFLLLGYVCHWRFLLNFLVPSLYILSLGFIFASPLLLLFSWQIFPFGYCLTISLNLFMYSYSLLNILKRIIRNYLLVST